MERKDLSYGVVVSTRGLRVHALLEEVIALRLGARRRSTGLCVYVLQGCEPFTLRRGMVGAVAANGGDRCVRWRHGERAGEGEEVERV